MALDFVAGCVGGNSCEFYNLIYIYRDNIL